MQEKLKRTIIRSDIKDNELFLLSSFGLEGIRKSWFKEKTILKILNRFDGDKEETLNIFFEELEEVYFEELAFTVFTYEELEKFINDEKLFMLARII